MEDEFLVLGELGLEVRRLGINPELEHPSGSMHGSWDYAFSLQLTDITDVDDTSALFVYPSFGLFG